MRARLVLTVLPVALLGAAAVPSLAAPAKPKPFSGTYEASAPVPAGYVGCDGTVPMTSDLRSIKIPAAGTFSVTLSDLTLDWDLFVEQNGNQLGASQDLQPLSEGEQVVVKVKRATTLTINACNFNGGPTGTVSYTFKPA